MFRNPDFLKRISLKEFEAPFRGRRKNLIIKITVVEPDPYLEKYGDSIQLYIGISGRP